MGYRGTCHLSLVFSSYTHSPKGSCVYGKYKRRVAYSTLSYGGPQLSRQKQIVPPQKQIASRQKQSGYGKSKLEMVKANLLRQKQIGNGNSQLVKVESKFVTAKANCTLRKCQTADEHRKSFRTKAKFDFDRKSKRLTTKAN